MYKMLQIAGFDLEVMWQVLVIVWWGIRLYMWPKVLIAWEYFHKSLLGMFITGVLSLLFGCALLVALVSWVGEMGMKLWSKTPGYLENMVENTGKTLLRLDGGIERYFARIGWGMGFWSIMVLVVIVGGLFTAVVYMVVES